MALPEDIYEEGRNYRIRVCILFEDNPIIGAFTNSVVAECDDCKRPIWVNPNQKVPEFDAEIHGDLLLCLTCTLNCYEQDPNPSEDQAEAIAALRKLMNR